MSKRCRQRGFSHRKVCIDQAKPLMTRFRAVALQLFRTKSPDHLIAEAAAPKRQMKRTLGPCRISHDVPLIEFRQIVRDAEMSQRRLRDYARRQRGQVKVHNAIPPLREDKRPF